LRTRCGRLLLVILPLLLAAFSTAVPVAAQETAHKSAPAKAKKAKTTKKAAAKKSAPKKAAAAKGGKKEGGKKEGGKKKGKKGKEEPIGTVPKTARAPALPRIEPIKLSAADRSAFAEAIKAAESRNWSHADAAIARTNNPLLHKVLDWAYLREPGGHVSFSERTAFIANNPGWPSLREMQRRAEEALGDQITVTVPAVLIGWFKEHPPVTTQGRVA
jgi:hypothetical protein